MLKSGKMEYNWIQMKFWFRFLSETIPLGFQRNQWELNLLSHIFPCEFLDKELTQSISLLAYSMSDEQHRMIVCICFELDNHNMDFASEKVKIEDLEVMEVWKSFQVKAKWITCHVCMFYHKDCIYQWLERNKSCISNNSIIVWWFWLIITIFILNCCWN